MNSLYLKTLVETVATGSLSKAADNLFITPSAASRRIKYLEDHYGYSLLDRSGPLLVPTEAGKWVIDKALNLLEIENDLLIGLKGIERMGGVLFCCTNSFGIAHLPRVLEVFMHDNPDTTNLKFYFDQPDNIVKGLRKNVYNLAVFEHCIHCECFSFDEFTTYRLSDDEVVFISSPDLGINSANTTMDVLFKHTLYGQNESACASKFLASNLKSMGRRLDEFKNVIVVDDLHLIINSVLTGNGIACISKGVVEKHINAGRLVQHHVEGFTHARKRTLATNQSKSLNLATGSLKGCIISYFSETVEAVKC
ncbi:MAG: LysR family transcriptional regulator [Geobacteraceae bacterium GWC2_48_7]|nr:MAG: LysR family transcriptional regulator [Geobacteraceae bacterium GWC2_48_7]